MIYNIMLVSDVQQSIQLYIIFRLFSIINYYVTAYSSLCYIVNPYLLWFIAYLFYVGFLFLYLLNAS